MSTHREHGCDANFELGARLRTPKNIRSQGARDSPEFNRFSFEDSCFAKKKSVVSLFLLKTRSPSPTLVLPQSTDSYNAPAMSTQRAGAPQFAFSSSVFSNSGMTIDQVRESTLSRRAHLYVLSLVSTFSDRSTSPIFHVPLQANNVWLGLRKAITEIQNGNASTLRFEELYRCVKHVPCFCAQHRENTHHAISPHLDATGIHTRSSFTSTASCSTRACARWWLPS